MYKLKVPAGWLVKRIEEFADISTGNKDTVNKVDNGKYPFFVRSQTVERIDSFSYDGEAVLTAGDGVGVGKVFHYINGKFDFHQRVYKISDFNEVNGFFFYNYFKMRFLKQVKKYNAKTSVDSVRREMITKMEVPIPPIDEQRKISSILLTWDKAIELKEKLIDKKKEQKKGLMQKLLTGEMRLPGFTGDWKRVRLEEIGKTYNGLSGKSAKDFGEGSPYIPYKTIFDDSKIDITKLDYVQIREGEKQNSVKYGDIFFTTSSETPHEVGMSSVLLNQVDEMYLNSFCFGYRLNDFDVLLPEFAEFLFRGNDFRNKTYRLAQGSTRFNISKTEVLKIEVLLPSIEEQKSIAAILSNSDREIRLLKSQVKFLKEQKTGLMQLLLTGKVRVQV